jgi:hypothetical protein
MFEFIKSLFKRKTTEDQSTPVLVHTDINESIVIKEVALAEVKPKKAKPKVTTLKEVKPAKEKPVVDNVVPLVQPVVEKAAKPKKPAKPKQVVVIEDFNLSLVVPPAKPKGRPKKTPTK